MSSRPSLVRLAELRRVGRAAWPPPAWRFRLGRLQALEVGHGLAGLGGGGEDGAVVFLQQLQPMRQILRMIGPHVLGDGELGAQEGAGNFGDQLFRDILLIAKALAEIAVEAVLGAAPVRRFMQGGRDTRPRYGSWYRCR